jgi:uncharacterized membrane protein
MPAFRRAFAAASCVWAAALPASAWIASGTHAAALSAASLLAYAIGAVVCHQRPERSFHLWAVQLPVCARCTGIYAASAAAALAAPLMPRARPAAARAVILLSLLPSAATLVFEWSTGSAPSNAVRALAGAPIGAAVAWTIVRL